MARTRENDINNIYSYVNRIFNHSESEGYCVTPNAFDNNNELNPAYMVHSGIYVFPFFVRRTRFLDRVGIFSIGFPDMSAEKVFSLEGSVKYITSPSERLMHLVGRKPRFYSVPSGRVISFHMIEGLPAICQTLKLIKKFRLKKFIEEKKSESSSNKAFLSNLLNYPFDQLPHVSHFFKQALESIESNSKNPGYEDYKNYKWEELLQYNYFKKLMCDKASDPLLEQFKPVLEIYNTSVLKTIHRLFNKEQSEKLTLLKKIVNDPQSFIKDGIDPDSLQFRGEFKPLLTSPSSVLALSKFQRQDSLFRSDALTLLEQIPSSIELIISELKEVDALSKFPPGLLPIVASYARP